MDSECAEAHILSLTTNCYIVWEQGKGYTSEALVSSDDGLMHVIEAFASYWEADLEFNEGLRLGARLPIPDDLKAKWRSRATHDEGPN